MKLVRCPDPDCGAYNSDKDTNCQKCYASLGTRQHVRETRKEVNQPRKPKWDDDEDDESTEGDRYKDKRRS